MKRLAYMFSRWVLTLVILAACILSTGAHAAETAEKHLVIIPFKVNAAQDLSYLTDGIYDMLYSRLAAGGEVQVIDRDTTAAAAQGPIDADAARDIGAALAADFVLFGTLTAFGDSYSIDAWLVDSTGEKAVQSFFVQAAQDDLLPQINQIATEIKAEVLERPELARSQPPAPPPPAATPNLETGPPQPTAPQPDKTGQAPSVFVREGAQSSGFSRKRNLKMEANGLALGDVVGDGRLETVILAGNSLLLMADQAGSLLKKAEFEAKSYQKFVTVDAADINQNGRAEIFITCVNPRAGNLDSLVLEWNGRKLEVIADGLKWYFRVAEIPNRGPVLFGQKRGVGAAGGYLDLFYGSVQELTWNDDSYQAVAAADLPRGVKIFGFAVGELTDDGQPFTVALDGNDRLRVYNPRGKLEWKGEERFGGSETYLLRSPQTEKRIFLPQRLIIADADQDGRREVIVVNNEAFTGRALKNFRLYSKGRVSALQWDGLGLIPQWSTRQVSGYFCDIAVGDIDGNGVQELLALVVLDRGSVFKRAKSAILVYDLAALQAL